MRGTINFFTKLNEHPIFDLSRWPHRETLARFCGISLCTAFIIHRILRFKKYTGDFPPLFSQLNNVINDGLPLSGVNIGITDWHWIMWLSVWIIETGIFSGYILAFLTRNDAKSIAKGFMEAVFPFIIAALPVLITLTPMNFKTFWPATLTSFPYLKHWETAFFLFLGFILLGGAINLTGLFTLRKAFAITSEARLFIGYGIYKFIRHPLYLGHFIMFFGYLMFHLYWYTFALYIVFLLGQYIRARTEENKLRKSFPEYAAYIETTGMFFPKL